MKRLKVCWIVGVVLITLRLFDAIVWPWWIVTIPLWGPHAALFTCGLTGILVAMIFEFNPFDPNP